MNEPDNTRPLLIGFRCAYCRRSIHPDRFVLRQASTSLVDCPRCGAAMKPYFASNPAHGGKTFGPGAGWPDGLGRMADLIREWEADMPETSATNEMRDAAPDACPDLPEVDVEPGPGRRILLRTFTQRLRDRLRRIGGVRRRRRS